MFLKVYGWILLLLSLSLEILWAEAQEKVVTLKETLLIMVKTMEPVTRSKPSNALNQLGIKYDDMMLSLNHSPATLLTLNTWTTYRTRYSVPEVDLEGTPEMEFFVTLINGWKSLINATKGFLLDLAMVFLRYISVKQLLKLIKNRLKLIYFFSYYSGLYF